MSNADDQSRQGLKCDRCGVGYASCRCPPVWAEEEEVKRRRREILDVREGVEKRLRKETLADLDSRMPESFVVMGLGKVVGEERIQIWVHESTRRGLEKLAHARGRSTAKALCEALLGRETGQEEGSLEVYGPMVRVEAVLPKSWILRARAEAVKKSKSFSELCEERICRELFLWMRKSE